MRRRAFLAGGATAVAALAGCTTNAGSPATETDPNDGTSGDGLRTIAVRKTGEVEAPPDLAILDFAVESRGETASSVRDDLSERAEDLYQALLDYGLSEDAVTTGEFRIHQRVDHRAMREDGVDPESEAAREEYQYYEGRQSFTVELEDVDATGEVIDTAVDAGADDVGRIVFTLSEETRAELREEAIATAVEKAREEAAYTADRVGMSVVDARRVDTSGGGVRPVREEYEGAGDARATPTAAPPERTELEPGDVTVTASVEIVYDME
jgi:uncharacterized protein YggE